jgi:hypothetical protein
MTSSPDAGSGRVPVDWDLVADFVGGALGPDESRRVEAFIATDTVWAAAEQELTAALVQLERAVAAAASQPEPMPADVHDRILTALAGLRALGPGQPPDGALAHAVGRDDVGPGQPPDGAVTDAGRPDFDPGSALPRPVTARTGGATSRRPAGREDATGPAGTTTGPDRDAAGARRRRQRRSRIGGFLIAVVIIAAFAGAIRWSGLTSGASGTGKAGSAVNAPAAEPNRLPQDFASGVTILHTGTDYTASTLTVGAPASLPGASPQPPGIGPAHTDAGQGPTELGPLSDAGSLPSCLMAITTAHPGRVTAIDYARYQGQPALIVWLADPAAAVAVGSRCGQPGAGDDERAYVNG